MNLPTTSIKTILTYGLYTGLFRIAIVLLTATALLVIVIASLNVEVALAKPDVPRQFPMVTTIALALPTNAVGDSLPRIDCGPGISATIYAENLTSPDGLAFSPAGDLYVAEELAGRVSQIGANGTITPVMTGLSNPEGIAFDSTGNLYVVEDIIGGRVVTRSTTGVTGTLASDLDAPEGIVWVSDGNPGGTLYVTEQNLENALNMSSTDPNDYRTHVTAISLTGTKIRILTTTAQLNFITFVPPAIDVTFWSYAGITLGPDGDLYFTNELSGQEVNDTVMGFAFHGDSTDSVYTATAAIAPTTRTSFADNTLLAPEGLRFSADGDFPLYVAEENIGGGAGRLSQVQSDGSISSFCTGFFAIEDVVVDQNGWFYVSEDTTGYIILIKPATTPNVDVSSVEIIGPISGSTGITYTFTATVSPNNSTTPVTYTWEAVDQTVVVTQADALSDMVDYSWSVTGTKTITVTADNGGTPVIDTHTIEIVAPSVDVSSVEITGPISGSTGITYTFTATVSPNNATTPVTYTWEAVDQTVVVTQADALSDMVDYSWSVTGTKTITVTADNAGTPVIDTHMIEITATETTPSVDVSSVEITGPISGSTGITYTFTATVSPNNSTTPVTYIWESTEQTIVVTQADELSDMIDYSWSVTGTKTITVTADNGGTPISDTHTIEITTTDSSGGGNSIYLPIIVKGV